MTGRAGQVALRIAAVIVAAAGGFAVLNGPARALESRAAVALLRPWGDKVFLASDTAIGVVPAGEAPFQAFVTPSCSSISALLAVLALSMLRPRHRRRRAVLATAAAAAVVVAGNIIRISASVGIGLGAGRSSLILFHDWVGSVFAFIYTLGGFILLLYLVLPRRSRLQVTHAG